MPENAARIMKTALILMGGGVLFAVFALLFAINSISRPILDLKRAVTEIAKGNLAHPIRSGRGDELGTLSNSIGDMVDALSEQRKMTYILDNLDSWICIADLDYNLVYINKTMEDFFGLNREKCIGQKCFKAVRRTDVPCSFCQMAELLPRKHEFPSKNFEYLYDGVRGIWTGGTDAIIRWVDDSLVFFRSFRDTTEKKKQKEQLEAALQEAKEASAAKTSFLARMSHEIRTPMNAILGISEIQLQDETIAPETRAALQKIYISGDLLLSIINNILDLSKIETGKMELSPVAYQVASLINDVVTFNMIKLYSKPIRFEVSVDENTPASLFGDDIRIKQILNNVLSNAFKYTTKGIVKLLVSAEAKGEGEEGSATTLILTVSDTGVGMTEDQVAKLFNEYARFNMDANREIEGTGLGMSITQKLVEMMNGRISLKSEPSWGTVVTIRLPQVRSAYEVIGRELAENLQRFQISGTKWIRRSHVAYEQIPHGRVLVVDDVESNLYVAKGLLTPYGLSIDTAESGFEAIDKIRGGKTYDIVFMDHMMPRMDGIEAVRIMREMGYAQPIVALTANAVLGQADLFLANGFDDFISKPIDVRQLNATLKKFVRDRHPPGGGKTAEEAGAKEPDGGEAPEASVDPILAEIFVRDAVKSATALEAVLEKRGSPDDGDMRTYVIHAHAVKSALANIGEADLSAKAAELEKAGSEGNATVVLDETPAFLRALRVVIENLSPPKEG